MTDDQWNAIVEYVRAELDGRTEFVIFHHDFDEMFGLSEQPYYQEMVARAEKGRAIFFL